MRSKSWISRSPKSTLLSARNLRMYARLLLIRARAEKRDKPEMRFYVNILTTYFPDRDPPYDAYYQQILEQIQLAEELGFECFMFNEHHFLGYGGLIADPAVMLAAAAARTSKIRLGTCIAIAPFASSAAIGRGLCDGGHYFRRQVGIRRGVG